MRVVEIKLLPDGSGRVRIHWFCRDEAGPATVKHGLIPGEEDKLKVGAVHGYIACQQARTDLGSQQVRGVIKMTHHTDDPRAATCPECMATPEFKAALRAVEELVPAPVYPVPE